MPCNYLIFTFQIRDDEVQRLLGKYENLFGPKLILTKAEPLPFSSLLLALMKVLTAIIIYSYNVLESFKIIWGVFSDHYLECNKMMGYLAVSNQFSELDVCVPQELTLKENS